MAARRVFLISRRISCALALSRSSSSSPRSALEELMKSESCEVKRNILLGISWVFDDIVDKAKTMEKMMEDNAKTMQRMEEDKAMIVAALKGQLQEMKESNTAKDHQILCVKGLNNTRGLFEYLEDILLQRSSLTRGLKGSEVNWKVVLSFDTALEAYLCKHLGSECNLPVYLASLYQILSRHEHAGKDLLSLTKGTIMFETYYLTPKQAQAMVCLGVLAGINVAPNPSSYPIREDTLAS